VANMQQNTKILLKLWKHCNNCQAKQLYRKAKKCHYRDEIRQFSKYWKDWGRMLNMNYVDCKNGKYIIFPDLKSYVEDIIEASTSKEAKDLVAPAYRNIFTPELKNYNLFANKRGYQ